MGQGLDPFGRKLLGVLCGFCGERLHLPLEHFSEWVFSSLAHLITWVIEPEFDGRRTAASERGPDFQVIKTPCLNAGDRDLDRPFSRIVAVAHRRPIFQDAASAARKI